MRKLLMVLALLIAVPLLAQGGPTYFYVVTGVDTKGFETGYSNEVSVTFAQGQKTAALTWVPSVVPPGAAPVAGYNAYRSQVKGGPYTKLNTALITSGATYSDSFTLLTAPSGLAVTAN